MYTDKLVVCLKVAGKILREFKDEVYIPYGSEYRIYVKNLNSVRASIDVTIDGTPLIAGKHSLVVDANSECEVERFVSDKEKGNRFRFIERTSKIEAHRGAKAEDGLIRVAFRFEQQQPLRPTFYPQNGLNYPPGVRSLSMNAAPGMAYGADASSQTMSVPVGSMNSVLRGVATTATNTVVPQSDVGITVPGSVSTQKFQEVADFPLETVEHVIVLHLLGDLGQNKRVEQPVTVKTRLICAVCGTKSKTSAKFCAECSTALEVVA